MIKDSYYLANEFIKKRDKPWVIFAGSAISLNKPSSLPNVNTIKSIVIEHLSDIRSNKLSKLDKVNISQYKNSLLNGKLFQQFNNIPFETLMSILYRNIPGFSSNFIVELFGYNSTKASNLNHEIIGLLIKNNLIRNVITTNFDLLIEEALIAKKIKSPSFIIQDNKENTDLLDFIYNNNRLPNYFNSIPLIKLHGCCSEKNSVIFTEESIDKLREKVLKVLPFLLENTYTIFIGYSGKDLLDIMPVIYDLSNNKKINIFWLYKDIKDIPKNLIAVFIKHDLTLNYSNNINALLAIARNTGIENEINVPFLPFPKNKEIEKMISPVIKKNISSGTNPELTLLKTFSSIFEHMKIGEISFEIANISKKIDKFYFSNLDYGRFYEILRLYPLAILSFKKGLSDKKISDYYRIFYYCSIGFCESVIGRLTVAMNYYKKANKIALKKNYKLTIQTADQLLRGQIEVILKSIEMRFTKKKQRLIKVNKLLDKLESFAKLDSNLYALWLRDLARLKVIQAKNNQDFYNAEKDALKAFKILEARNQFEGMTVEIRTLISTNPKKYLKELVTLKKITFNRKYWQEFIKLSIFEFQSKIFRYPKALRLMNKSLKIILSLFWFLKPALTLLIWSVKRLIKPIIKHLGFNTLIRCLI